MASNVISLIVLFVLVGIALAIGLMAYTIANEVAGNAQKKMEQKNITFTREGMKVGVKDVSAEKEGDKTQRYINLVYPELGADTTTVF